MWSDFKDLPTREMDFIEGTFGDDLHRDLMYDPEDLPPRAQKVVQHARDKIFDLMGVLTSHVPEPDELPETYIKDVHMALARCLKYRNQIRKTFNDNLGGYEVPEWRSYH